ncbi:sugar kinase [Pelosinus sp. sgz500959]|uniref:sugar kinase n=1 Tax=Pelosinus sp. sgz500959 TaxID=3242472 RepID=UPI00366DE394
MCEILTLGEPMALFLADQEGALDQIENFTKLVAGAEVNFAIGMARLGHNVAYITKLGEDPFGKYINNFLLQNKIDTRYVTFDTGHFTGFQMKSKVQVGDPEVFYFRRHSAASHLQPEDINTISWDSVKHLHVTGIPPALSLDCRDVIYELTAIARKKGICISFDTNLRPQLWKSKEEMIRVINDLAFRSDIVLPGINEGKILTGSDDPNVIADFYLTKGVKTVIIKLGDKGAFVKTQDTSFFVDGFKVETVIDTVGAGDGFAVGVVSGLRAGLSLKEAVVRGNAIGALAVMSPGDNDGLPNKQELDKYLKDNFPSHC